MPEAFRITSMVPGLPGRVYSAWLDSAAHSSFTGKAAKVDPSIGGKFSTLDGYVHGRTVDLLPGRRIVQTWRTKEFPHAAHDSRLEIQFESAEGATRLTILHSLLPDGHGARCKKTWLDAYFAPMRGYFGRLDQGGPANTTAARPVPDRAAPPPRATPPKPKPTAAPSPPARKPAPKPAAARKPAPAKKAGKKKSPKAPKAAARRPEKKKPKKRR